MQGVLDFSMILGERVFKNREIEYKFQLFNTPYSERKLVEAKIKQLVMPHGEQALYDSHDPDYYWLGKCKSIEIEDDEKYKTLVVSFTFDCYPFMIGKNTYFTDVWDDFNFTTDVSNFTKYEVDGTQDIKLFNSSVNSVKPEVVSTGDFKVTLRGETFKFGVGKTNNVLFSLGTGLNELTVSGHGTIAFHYRTEVMA